MNLQRYFHNDRKESVLNGYHSLSANDKTYPSPFPHKKGNFEEESKRETNYKRILHINDTVRISETSHSIEKRKGTHIGFVIVHTR